MADNIDLNLQIAMRDNASRSVKTLESNIIRFVGAVSAALASIKITLFPITQAVEFEAELKNVQKTTNFTQAEIDKLSESFLGMARSVGVSATELAGIAAIAGQLGLGQEGRQAVEEFTKSVAIASVTLGVATEEAANAGSQIKSIFNLPIDSIENVFSVINELSNNSVAAASDIIDIVKRVGTAADATFPQVAALAATMRDVGVPNEQAGTALVKFLSNMLSEADKFADAVGLSTQEWVDLVKEDSIEALKFVATELANIQDDAARQAGLIQDLFGAGRLFSAAAKIVDDASNNFAILNKNLAISEDEFVKGTSSLREYETIMDAVGKQADVLKSTFQALGIEVGEQSLPIIKEALEDLSETLADPTVIEFFVEVGKSLGGLVKGLVNAGKAVTEYADLIDELIAVFKIWIAVIAPGIAIRFVKGFATAIIGAFSPIRTFISLLFTLNSAMNSFARGNALFGISKLFGRDFAVALGKAILKLKDFTATIVAAASTATGLFAKIGAAAAAAGSAVLIPLGLAAGLAFLLAIFWDDLKEFLGIVDEETARRNAEVRNARRNAIQQMKNDADEFASIIEKVRKISDRPINFEETIKSGAGGLAKATKELVTELGLLVEAQDKLPSAIQLTQSRLRAYGDEAQLLQKKISDLRKESESIRFRTLLADTVFAGGELTDFILGGKTIEEVNAEIDTYVDRLESIQEATKGLNKDYDELIKSSDEIAEKFKLVSEQSKNLFTREQIDFFGAAFDFDEAQKRFNELDKSLQELLASRDELIDSGDDVPVGLVAQITNQQRQVNEAKESLEGLTERLNTATEALGAQTKSTTEFYNSLTFSQKKANAETQQGNRQTVQSFDELVQSLRQNVHEAIAFAASTKVLADRWKEGAKVVEDFKKKARGVFDNTSTEIDAAVEKIEKFSAKFKANFRNLKAEINIKTKLDNVDKGLEQAKKDNTEFFDFITQNASSAEIEILESLEETYNKELEFNAQRKKEQIEANELARKFADTLRQQKDFFRQAQDAASNAEGSVEDLQRALALKELGKETVDELINIFDEAKKLEKTNLLGGTELAFSEEDLTSMFQQIVDSKVELETGIRGVNENLLDTAIKIEDQFKKSGQHILSAADAAQRALAPFVNNLQGVNEEVERLSKLLDEQFPATIKDLGEVLDKFSLSSGVSIDTAKLFDDNKEAISRVITAAALEGVQRATFQVRDQVGGAVTQQGVVIKVPFDDDFIESEKRKITNEPLKDPLKIRLESIDTDKIVPEAQTDLDFSNETLEVGLETDLRPNQQTKIQQQLNDQAVTVNQDVSLRVDPDTAQIAPSDTSIVIPASAEVAKDNISVPEDPVDISVKSRIEEDDISVPDSASSEIIIPGRVVASNSEVTTQDGKKPISKADIQYATEQVKEAYREAVKDANLATQSFINFDKDQIIEEAKKHDGKAEIKVRGKVFRVEIDESGQFSFSDRLGQKLKKAVEEQDFTAVIDEIKAKPDSVLGVPKAEVESVEFSQQALIDAEQKAKLPIAVDLNEDQVKEELSLVENPELPINGSFLEAQLQGFLDKIKTLKVDIQGNVTTSGIQAPGFSKGGQVRGPGTSTSDSILAWLSNKEYVIDAATTRFFGSDFFAGLQSFARGKSSGNAYRLGLPAFAAGGPVDIPSVAFSSPSGIIEKVEVTINDLKTNSSSRVLTDREGARQLVDAFKKMRG